MSFHNALTVLVSTVRPQHHPHRSRSPHIHLRLIAALSLLSSTVLAAEDPLEEVVVTALAVRSSIDDAIQPVELLAGDDLQRQLSTSIGETLAKQPGITATYFGPNASRPVIRGLSGERVQMLEDSIGALDVSSLSEDHAVSIEDSLATQIEIVKGPAALLYGSGAVGGVVNVLTNRIPERAPMRAVSGSAELRTDTATQARTGVATLELGNEVLAVHLDGYRKRSDDVTVPGSAFSAAATVRALADDPDAFLPKHRIYNSASDSSGGSAGVSLLGERGLIGVAVSGFDTQYGVPLAPGENPSDGGPKIDMQQTRYDLKAQLDGNDDSWWQAVRVRAAHNNYQHAELEADGAVGTQFNQQGTEARVAVDHQFGQLQGSAGVQYRYLDFAAIGTESFVPASVSRNTGVFVFEQYNLNPLTLEAGLRTERQEIMPSSTSGLPSYQHTASSASLGGLWKLNDNDSLALNLTRSQRHPSATELYADGPHEATGQFVIGDPGFKPETANTVDLIWRGGEQLHWHVSAYLERFTHYLYLAPTGDTEDALPVYVYRQGEARYVGAEASLHWHLFERDAAHLDLQLTSDYVRATLGDGSPVPQIPPLRFGAELEYHQGQWLTSLSAFHYNSQDRIADNETTTAGYTLVDASLRYEWALSDIHTLQTFLRGTNLTNSEARRHTSPLKEYAPLPGRSASLGVTLKF